MSDVVASLTILGLSAGAGIGAAKALIEKLLGPAIEAVGTGAAAPLVAWKEKRVKNATDILTRTAEILAAQNDEPHPVPGRILMPILERASLEDEPSMRERWARLLAAAARGVKGPLPAHVNTLAQLAPEEAVILDKLIETFAATGAQGVKISPWHLEEASGIPSGYVQAYFDNWVRLGLVKLAPPELPSADIERLVDRRMRKINRITLLVPMRVSLVASESYVFTDLGLEFMLLVKNGEP
jgi:hypothetical protein